MPIFTCSICHRTFLLYNLATMVVLVVKLKNKTLLREGIDRRRVKLFCLLVHLNDRQDDRNRRKKDVLEERKKEKRDLIRS